MTLLGVSRDLLTSQTTSITISISVVSTMQNTFGTRQSQFQWHLFNATSKQFYGLLHWVHKVEKAWATKKWNSASLDGDESEYHCKLNAGRIPARLKCFFVVENAESSVKGLFSLVQAFGTGLICQTAGMVIVEESYQPPMQPLHNGSYRREPHFGIRTTYIVFISAIEGAVHIRLLMP